MTPVPTDMHSAEGRAFSPSTCPHYLRKELTPHEYFGL